MAITGLILTIIAGWLGWSGWLSIPFGALLYWGSLRAIPENAHRVNRLGIPIYALGTFILMKVAGWLQSIIM